MASNHKFNATTTSDEVISAFANQVKDRYFLLTGPTAGTIGAAVLLALAKGSPAGLILAGRTLSKFQSVADEIKQLDPSVKVFVVTLDLASLDSVRKAAQDVLDNAEIPRLDVLINNAGIMAQPFSLTMDGIESQFGTNHVGHFLFTNLLMPKLKLAQSGTPSVVNVSSSGHRFFRGDFADPNFKTHSYDIWEAYGQSKAANIIFSKALAARGIRATSLHPGLVRGTQLGSHLSVSNWLTFMGKMTCKVVTRNWEGLAVKTTAQAAPTVLVAALDLGVPNGAYLYDCQVFPADKRIVDDGARLAGQLWEVSNELVKERFV
ncbi:NAD(P)-binding protein [Auriculariales sp. MPI-PUGE-AT-0066]|nr:NAD(P)-binding protein [Auriculariales sp. MPI-PUGE-AT-0066]